MSKVEIFKFDRKTMFEFRTGKSKGVVIAVDYKRGELMRKGTCGVRVFDPGTMAYRVRLGFAFEAKHTVLYSPSTTNLTKGQ
jgi:hypothetical protein